MTIDYEDYDYADGIYAKLKLTDEQTMTAADLSPADWLTIQRAVSNDEDIENGSRIRLVDAIGDFYASSKEHWRDSLGANSAERPAGF